jgi:hypothetical protein
MIISRIFLGTKYKISQFVGAFIVILGLLVALIFNSKSDSSSSDNSDCGAGCQVIWSLVLVSSSIPMCLSSVYKEKALGDNDIDAIYLNGWVAVFQFLFSIPLLWPSALAENLPMNQIWNNLYDGMLCLGGVNSVIANSTQSNDSFNTTPDNCALSPAYVSAYVLFNIVYNILIILILKYGSSNILWLSMTTTVPMANFAFSLDFVPNHTPITLNNVISLLLIMIGLVVYRLWNSISHWFCCQKSEPLLDADFSDGLTEYAEGHGASQDMSSTPESAKSFTPKVGTPDRGSNSKVHFQQYKKSSRSSRSMSNQE